MEQVEHTFAMKSYIWSINLNGSVSHFYVEVTRATETMIRLGIIILFFDLNTIECIIQSYNFVMMYCDRATMSTYLYVHIIMFLFSGVIMS